MRKNNLSFILDYNIPSPAIKVFGSILDTQIHPFILRRGGDMEEKRPPFNVEIGEKESEGIYSNFVLIAHSPSEFILDFARILPGVKKAKVFARIVMTPQHAMLLKNALDENIKRYEDRFGKIKIVGKPETSVGFQPETK